MSDFEHALEAELLAAARRRTAARAGAVRPRSSPWRVATASLASSPSSRTGRPPRRRRQSSSSPCSARSQLLGAGPCTSNPFSSLSQ